MQYTSPHLFHFVGRHHPADEQRCVDVLRAVLSSECISAPPHKKGWGPLTFTIDPSKSLVKGELVIPSMVCFCDIPDAALGLHISKYGPCGIALSRKHLVKYGAMPVMYYPYDPSDPWSIYGVTGLRDIESCYLALREMLDKLPPFGPRSLGKKATTLEEAADVAQSVFLTRFLGFLKPFDATLPKDHINNFYMEREWRRLGNVVFTPDVTEKIVAPARFLPNLRAEFPSYAGKFQPP